MALKLFGLERLKNQSPCALTFGEMLANVGIGGKSFVQKTQAKLSLWPIIGDTKAVRVGPALA